MLNARAIYRLLIDDEQPVQPPDDPRQMALDFNADELVDPKAEIMRYAETPFRIPGDGPTTTYQHFLNKFDPDRRYRKWDGQEGTRFLRLKGRNTYLIDYGDRIAVRYHQTDVVTAYRDGKVVVDAGGWHPQGDKVNYGWRAPAGTTTRDRIGYMAGTAGGWDIYQKSYVWYWYNRGTRTGNWEDTVRYPYTDGDTIYPDGSLQLQAEPEDVRRRRKRT